MNKSIMQNKKQCFVCGVENNLHFHHIMFGKNRKKADEDGLTVYLCYKHHEGTNGVHGKNGHDLDMKLKKEAMIRWCEYYKKTPEEFMKKYYCKNYVNIVQ